jgi:hypothetical protein
MTRTLTRAAALLFSVILAAACSASDSVGAGGGNAAGCTTCQQVYTNGGITCGPGDANDAWETLAHCACGAGPCASACGDPTGETNFCGTGPANSACSSCLGSSCTSQLQGCAAN